MKIKFKKGEDKDILECTRDDGSMTWCKVQPGMIYHDMLHYLLESATKTESAFYGLLKKGFDIQDFEGERADRPKELLPSNLTDDAIAIEIIAGIMQHDAKNRFENIEKTIEEIFVEKTVSSELLKQINIEALRKDFGDMIIRWKSLNPGELLEVNI